MNKFKRIISIAAVFSMVLGFSVSNIFAAMNVYISAPQSANVGDNVTISIVNSSNGEISLHGTLSVSGVATGSKSIAIPADGKDSITVKANSSGVINVSFSGHYSEFGIFVDKSITRSASINVSSPSSGGSGSGGGTTTPPPKVETPAEKAAREERERIAREKAEEADKAKKEAEEALEKEKAAKTPLFEGIEIISTSAKRNGKVITTIAPEFDVFEYVYKLPSNIDSIKLNVLLAEGSDTTLAYDLEHEISGTKDIDINAVLGDVTQDFKLSISTDDEELLKRDDGYVYSDEMLNDSMTDLGFSVEELEVDGVKSNKFVLNNLSLQLVVDEDNEAEFYRLDENNSVVDRGQIIVDDSEVYFVSSIVPEDFQDYKLHGNSLNSTEIVAPEFLSEVDESLSLKQNIRGWALDDGVLLYASDSNDTVEFVSFTADEGIKSAIVAFDKVDNTLLYAFYAVSGALLVTIVAFGYYVFLQRKKSTNIDTY